MYTMATVLGRRRKPSKPQEKKRIVCEFMGTGCPFMKAKDNGVFRNPTDFKYVSLHDCDYLKLINKNLGRMR